MPIVSAALKPYFPLLIALAVGAFVLSLIASSQGGWRQMTTKLWRWVLTPSVLGLGGLGCLVVGGAQLADFFASGGATVPALSSLHPLKGQVVTATSGSQRVIRARELRDTASGWVVTIAAPPQPPLTLSIGEWPPFGPALSMTEDFSVSMARVQSLLPRGANVTGYFDDAHLVWHLEREGQVLVDYESRRAARRWAAVRDQVVMLGLLLLGALMCWSGFKRWRNAPAANPVA